MNDIQNINFSFRLASMDLLERTYVASAKPLSEKPIFHFDISIEHKLNTSAKTVMVSPCVKILSEDKSAQLGSIKIACFFYIENLSDFQTDENEVNLPEQVVVTLNSVSLSTLRGVMFSEFRGTQLHNAILPIIDPKAFQTK